MRLALRGLFLAALATPMSLAAPSSGNPDASFTFSLGEVEGGKVTFLGGAGCHWGGVSYGGISFVVSRDGVRGPVESPEAAKQRGLGVEPRGKELVLTCRASACAVVSTSPDGTKDERNLGERETISVPASAKLVITVTE